MTLARSASVPGGLSINTGAANLFGSSTPKPPAAGSSLFTPPTATQTTAPATTMASAGGLFGSSTAATSQPAAAPSLFGSKPSLFGTSQPAAQPAQATGGGLFGQTTTSTPAQTGGGGLFGQSTTAAKPSLFGGSLGAQQTQQQQPAGLGSSLQTGGLFGKPAQPVTGGLFGQSQQQQPQSTGLFGGSKSMFAASTPQPGPGLTMGQSTTAASTVPGVRIDLSNIKGTTRFNDLQEDLQKEITKLDTLIQSCMEQKNQVEAFMPAHGEQIAAIPNDVRFVQRKYDGAANALHGDAQMIKGLREMHKVDVENAKLSFKATDNLKLPAQYHTSGLWSTKTGDANGDGEGGGSSDLINFFSRTGSEMEEMLKKFGSNISEIEGHVHGVQGNLLEQLQRANTTAGGVNGAGGVDEKVAELAAVLREFEASILQVAGVVGGAREGMTELQVGALRGNGNGR